MIASSRAASGALTAAGACLNSSGRVRICQASGMAGSISNTGVPIASAAVTVWPVPPGRLATLRSHTAMTRSVRSIITRPASATLSDASASNARPATRSAGSVSVASHSASTSPSRSASSNRCARAVIARIAAARAATAGSAGTPPACKVAASARVEGWALIAQLRSAPNGSGTASSHPRAKASSAAI